MEIPRQVQSAMHAATLSVIRAREAGPVEIDPAIRILRGDITKQEVDVVVNAANTSLLGGGGVDGAIHAAGGPAIIFESRQLGGAFTGEAKATTAGMLPATHVVHAVGPRWEGGHEGEPVLLALAYRNSVIEASRLGARSIAFPSISTGIYGFPLEEGARIALASVTDTLRDIDHQMRDVRFVTFDAETHDAFERAAGITRATGE